MTSYENLVVGETYLFPARASGKSLRDMSEQGKTFIVKGKQTAAGKTTYSIVIPYKSIKRTETLFPEDFEPGTLFYKNKEEYEAARQESIPLPSDVAKKVLAMSGKSRRRSSKRRSTRKLKSRSRR